MPRIPRNARASKWNVHMVRCETKYEYYSATVNRLTGGVLTFDSDFAHSLAKVRKTNTSRVAPSPRGEQNIATCPCRAHFRRCPHNVRAIVSSLIEASPTALTVKRLMNYFSPSFAISCSKRLFLPFTAVSS